MANMLNEPVTKETVAGEHPQVIGMHTVAKLKKMNRAGAAKMATKVDALLRG